ncbi:hypothetical protein Tco_0846407 [Tanacetum coccineum]
MTSTSTKSLFISSSLPHNLAAKIAALEATASFDCQTKVVDLSLPVLWLLESSKAQLIPKGVDLKRLEGSVPVYNISERLTPESPILVATPSTLPVSHSSSPVPNTLSQTPMESQTLVAPTEAVSSTSTNGDTLFLVCREFVNVVADWDCIIESRNWYGYSHKEYSEKIDSSSWGQLALKTGFRCVSALGIMLKLALLCGFYKYALKWKI